MKTNIPDELIPIFKEIKKSILELQDESGIFAPLAKQMAILRIKLLKDTNNNYIFGDERLYD